MFVRMCMYIYFVYFLCTYVFYFILWFFEVIFLSGLKYYSVSQRAYSLFFFFLFQGRSICPLCVHPRDWEFFLFILPWMDGGLKCCQKQSLSFEFLWFRNFFFFLANLENSILCIQCNGLFKKIDRLMKQQLVEAPAVEVAIYCSR